MMADGSPWWADEGDGVKPDWGGASRFRKGGFFRAGGGA